MSKWLSIHVWYHDLTHHDDLIVLGIKPLVHKLRSEKVLRRCFFIRYWTGGPHVRLRLLPESNAAGRCRDVVEMGLSDYLAMAPSVSTGVLRLGHRGVPWVPEDRKSVV